MEHEYRRSGSLLGDFDGAAWCDDNAARLREPREMCGVGPGRDERERGENKQQDDNGEDELALHSAWTLTSTGCDRSSRRELRSGRPKLSNPTTMTSPSSSVRPSPKLNLLGSVEVDVHVTGAAVPGVLEMMMLHIGEAVAHARFACGDGMRPDGGAAALNGDRAGYLVESGVHRDLRTDGAVPQFRGSKVEIAAFLEHVV